MLELFLLHSRIADTYLRLQPKCSGNASGNTGFIWVWDVFVGGFALVGA